MLIAIVCHETRGVKAELEALEFDFKDKDGDKDFGFKDKFDKGPGIDQEAGKKRAKKRCTRPASG
jgi:hypothetical protein